jgi:hypothetical protein
MLEIGVPATWQVLAFALAFVAAAVAVGMAAGSEALRVKAASLAARRAG